MAPHRTKPVIVIRYEIDGETIVVLRASRLSDWIRMTPGDEVIVKLPLFRKCPECGGYYCVETILASHLQKGIRIGTEPPVETAERPAQR